MAIDPVASALDALVTHLGTALGGSYTVLRGWPEHNTDLDLSGGPTVSVVAGEPTETRISPYLLGTADELDDEDEETGNLVATYKVANLEIPVQIDVWAAYRESLDSAMLAVGEALENQAPLSSGLWLTQSDYYSRPLSFDVTGSRRPDDADAAAVGEWRGTFLLRCSASRVAQRTWPKATEITSSLELGTTVTT